MRVAVLIPALNEAEALPALLAELLALPDRPHRVIVADNGSTDRTALLARESGAEVVLEEERGYGAACLAGLRHLAASGAPDVVAFMDADGSDDPTMLPSLLEPIRTGWAQFVVGVRIAPPEGESNAVPLHARWGNGLVRGLARRLHGAEFRDLGPFRAIRYRALEALQMDDRSWGWTLQMQLRAHRMGLATAEVPVPHRARTGGASKVSGSVVGSVRAGAKMLYTLASERGWTPEAG